MKKYIAVMLGTFLLLLFSYGSEADAQDLNKGQIYGLLEEAFQKQVSLSEESRSLEEISEVLDTHFTDSFKKTFIHENVVKTDGGYATAGTDFAFYYIPFFSYSENTEVTYEPDTERLLVREYFPGSVEGPVNSEDHYETVVLVKEDGTWKIADVLYDNEQAKGSTVSETADMSPSAADDQQYKPFSVEFMENPKQALFSIGILFIEQIYDSPVQEDRKYDI
ncbi:DUF3993 domain-containing protein [Bacillus sp. CECT 9360]|uniref:DUF3993 domain-containing protein n=1 Tax=Bacillus sp. CECT 9360 TaxID=2845821 RepID=UPI001E2A109D|nr:DUF3993 domain-containing protein [Bacillus sp. CECT 9360]CAH0345900.1 hypothetical protein BCI9360_02204 [Bacillus sp. CECT 9360]